MGLLKAIFGSASQDPKYPAGTAEQWAIVDKYLSTLSKTERRKLAVHVWDVPHLNELMAWKYEPVAEGHVQIGVADLNNGEIHIAGQHHDLAYVIAHEVAHILLHTDNEALVDLFGLLTKVQ